MPMDTQKVMYWIIPQNKLTSEIILEKELLAAMRLCDMCGV